MVKNATIKDVAAEAGVSIGTVDRVIHKRGRYSEQTERSVKEAIVKLNYTPSRIASSLVNMKKHIKIGVNYPDVSGDDFCNEIRRGVKDAQTELTPFGVEIITSTSKSLSATAQKKAIQSLLKQNVNGIITLAFDNSSSSIFLREYVPADIPFATVTNTAWNAGQLFHIGPDDTALGTLMARLVSLYCPASNISILAPNYSIENTQRRINGFMRKMEKEYPQINIQQIYPITSSTFEEICKAIEEKTAEIIDTCPTLDAIYITNGMLEPCARIIDKRNSSIRLFGHEYFRKLPYYLEKGIITATLYQHTPTQWKEAIKKMYFYLNKQSSSYEDELSECSILIKETLPFINIDFNQSL